jgi:WhiB family redox-sensing transcriptional regulator
VLWPPDLPGAACRRPEVDPAWFFPVVGETGARAKRVCETCPVRDECLAFAVNAGYGLRGIWAGTSERERRHLRRGLT